MDWTTSVSGPVETEPQVGFPTVSYSITLPNPLDAAGGAGALKEQKWGAAIQSITGATY